MRVATFTKGASGTEEPASTSAGRSAGVASKSWNDPIAEVRGTARPGRAARRLDVDPARPGGGRAAKEIEAVALAAAEPAAIAGRRHVATSGTENRRTPRDRAGP